MEQKMASQTPSRKQRRLLITTVAFPVVFVFLLVLWYYMPALGSNESAYCARCHAMTPEYLTWKESNHSQFQCKECHRPEGVNGFFRYQVRTFRELLFFRYSEGAVKVGMNEPMPSSACLRCHSENRQYSPFSDTVVPHQKHQDKGITCVQCHAGVAHGQIVKRGITKKVPLENWNASVAIEQMDYKYTTPRMAVCLDCHGKRQVTEKCSDCHSQQIVPASHKSRDFERQHGLMAQNDFKPCNLCHSYSFAKNIDLTKIDVQGYINNNSFCYNCHLQKPSTHKGSSFLESHSSLVKSRGISNCTGCHAINQPNQGPEGRAINQVYCNKCHWFD